MDRERLQARVLWKMSVASWERQSSGASESRATTSQYQRMTASCEQRDAAALQDRGAVPSVRCSTALCGRAKQKSFCRPPHSLAACCAPALLDGKTIDRPKETWRTYVSLADTAVAVLAQFLMSASSPNRCCFSMVVTRLQVGMGSKSLGVVCPDQKTEQVLPEETGLLQGSPWTAASRETGLKAACAESRGQFAEQSTFQTALWPFGSSRKSA